LDSITDVSLLVTCVRSQGAHLEQAVADARAQDLDGYEIVVASQVPPQRTQGLHWTDGGGALTEAGLLHAAVRSARGEMLVWFRAGDRSAPERVRRVLEAHRLLGAELIMVRVAGSAPPPTSRLLPLAPPELFFELGCLGSAGAFTRELFAGALSAKESSVGTVEGIAANAALRGGIALVDDVLVTLRSEPAPAPEGSPAYLQMKERRLAREVQRLCAPLQTLYKAPDSAARNKLISHLTQRVIAVFSRHALVRARLRLSGFRAGWSLPDPA